MLKLLQACDLDSRHERRRAIKEIVDNVRAEWADKLDKERARSEKLKLQLLRSRAALDKQLALAQARLDRASDKHRKLMAHLEEDNEQLVATSEALMRENAGLKYKLETVCIDADDLRRRARIRRRFDGDREYTK